VGRIDEERAALRQASDLDAALLAGSRLPGPRANLELVQAAADVGTEADFRRWLATDPAGDGPIEFLPVCALVGFGRLAAERHPQAIGVLREWAGDPRWRVREAVAMGLQRLGDADLDRLLAEGRVWGAGNAFERRAAVAALSEPRFLTEPRALAELLDLLDDCTGSIARLRAAADAGCEALLKALGYAWSVAVAAAPDTGRAADGALVAPQRARPRHRLDHVPEPAQGKALACPARVGSALAAAHGSSGPSTVTG
jgi:hypothetical protein